MGGGELADPPDFGSGVIQVRALGTQLHASVAQWRSASSVRTRPQDRYLPEAPCDRSVQRLARHLAKVSGPVRIRSVALDAVLAQWQEALRSDRRGSGFESLGRYSLMVNHQVAVVIVAEGAPATLLVKEFGVLLVGQPVLLATPCLPLGHAHSANLAEWPDNGE